ncbi:MAG: MotA/TolQ/ExbB proton channel family protein [Verrucomicrobiaceae bacterium]|nr:MotA/TolQ/ExbB proton channel family protein [Verrucomicrobiaceae bacterium]
MAKHLTLIKDISKTSPSTAGWLFSSAHTARHRRLGHRTREVLLPEHHRKGLQGVPEALAQHFFRSDCHRHRRRKRCQIPRRHRQCQIHAFDAQIALYQIYHLGGEEINHRIKNSSGTIEKKDATKPTKGLSCRSIQAIKATLHGGMVREVQKLNGKLVFLTIGIAGGPYLGLLGTVIGVMITFAVIAKSGEVEVNSIAPGIAGALLATVAGLAVAIPALFIYSYLSSRIKDVVTNMETFIDEFIAKMAEHHKEA